MTITWAEMEKECQGFREGFVACFRRHEGEETDKPDPRHQHKMVRVTMRSFAGHFGIAYTTFHDWVVPPPPRRRRSTVRTDTVNTVDHDVEIIADDDLFKAEVMRRREDGQTIKQIAKEMQASRPDVQRFAGLTLTHPENSIACGVEPARDNIKEIDNLCTRLLGKVYTLGEQDLKRLENVLGLHLAEVQRRLSV